MLGATTGTRIGITGLGTHVPDRVMTNDELARIVDTSDEWIRERTGIRERRFASDDEALTDIAMPAAVEALADAAVDASDVDLLICATVTPDMMFPTSSALLADALGMPKAAAYDLLAGCTGFVYAIAQAYGMLASGLSRCALVVGGDVLSKILDWEDRSTLVLFGDGAGAVVMEPVDSGGFLGFELGADGGGGENLWYPGSGSRKFENPEALLKMNGREVFKFATRIMVHSAQEQQFHPEVHHTPRGKEILSNFLFRICKLNPLWTMASFIESATESIRQQVGDGRVICALSGGVDSSVTACWSTGPSASA